MKLNMAGNAIGYPKPPPRQQCPLCTHPLPLATNDSMYMTCCGKTICLGCLVQSHKWAAKTGMEYTCAFCRQPDPVGKTEEEADALWNARLFKRVNEFKDPKATYCLALAYLDGDRIPKNQAKGLELLHDAADLGSPQAGTCLSSVYREGYPGSDICADPVKSREYLEKAAYIGGDDRAWHNLGIVYSQEGDSDKGKYHFCMAASYGNEESTSIVKKAFAIGEIEEEDYNETMRACRRAQKELTNEARIEAKKRFPDGGSIYL